MKTKLPYPFILVFTFLSAFACMSAYAQDSGDSVIEIQTLDSADTLALLIKRRDVVSEDATLTESQKTAALILFNRAIKAIHATERLSREIEELRERSIAAPQRILELSEQLELEQVSIEIDPNQFADLPIEEIFVLAEKARQDLEAARDEFYRSRVAVRQLSVRPVEKIGIDNSSPRLVDTNLGDTLARLELGTLFGSREQVQQAVRNERHAKRDLSREWFANFDRILQLEILELELALIELNRLTARFESLMRVLERFRMEEAREERENAEVDLASMSAMPDAIRGLAEENLRLRIQVEKTLELEAAAARLLRSERANVELFEVDFEYTQRRLDTIGPNPAMGRLIRDRLEGLPSLVQLEQGLKKQQIETERAVEERIELERSFRNLLLPETVTAGILKTIPQLRMQELGESWVYDEVKQLLISQRKNAEELYTLNGRYLLVLAELGDTRERISQAVRNSLALAADELLWIPSMPPVSGIGTSHYGRTLQWLVAEQPLSKSVKSLSQSFFQEIWIVMGALIALGILVYFRPKFRRSLIELSELVQRVRTDAFRHSLSALVYSVALAGAWPLGLILLGWLVRSNPGGEYISVAVGQALIIAGRVLFPLSLARWILQPWGLSRHFRWPETICSSALFELMWFVPVFLGGSVLVAFSKQMGIEEVSLSVGRPALIIVWLAIAILTWRLLGPRSEFHSRLLEAETPTILRRRWRFFLVSIMMAISLLPALSSGFGYQYAAIRFSSVFILTLYLIGGLLILRDILMRWFYVAERRMRLESMLRRREEARADRERSGETEVAESSAAGIEVEEIEIDYRQLGQQGRTFIRVGVVVGMLLGLWVMWGDLLPAISILDRVELPFTQTLVEDGLERQVAVTLADLALVLMVLAIAYFASRNLAGLLGFTVLRPLRFDAGASYAIVTLCQYMIIAVAIIYAFSSIGLEWSKLQWLVAALGVGLGFGLQEIVANFVSGIILLIERPVRVGDIVTVGDAEGFIARIRIRATTIVTWEGKEMVVPNKEFITQRVLNWTLSNSQMRLYFEVGVAYGSDIALARQLVLDTLDEAEHVLKDPSPNVTFGSFGDSSLNLEVRCYLPNFDHWHSTRTEIHSAIYEKFNKAGITISFPQRDVHLDVTGPLDVQLRREGPRPDPV